MSRESEESRPPAMDAPDAERFFELLASALAEAADAAARELSGEAVEGDAAPPRDRADDGANDAVVGTMVGHYRIDARIGRGGMGVVYRAFDVRLRRSVALKLLPSSSPDDHRAAQRLLGEARAAAALDHVNICTVYEVGEASGRAFIAMAFYPGETLGQMLRRGPLPVPQAVDYATQIARGLAAAHASGIIHRDVKPGNIIVTPDGVLKLLDFGIARAQDGSPQVGVTPGTIAYMSPEQVTGGPVDARADLWSLGVVLYEMCTGVRPFGGADANATLAAIVRDTPPRAGARREVPARVAAIIDRLLTKLPDERYRNAEELLSKLTAALPAAGRPPWRASPNRKWLVAGAVGVAAIGALTWAVVSGSPETEIPRERIVVADAVGDTTVFAKFVTERLRQGLARSRRLSVLGDAEVAGVLRRMGRDPNVRLEPEIAREIARREGVKAIVRVNVNRTGDAYAIGATLMAAASGAYLDADQATARNVSELAKAIDRLTETIRKQFGESLASIDSARAPYAYTTESIDALLKHFQAVDVSRSGDYLRGIGLLEEAIAIDPQFAHAYVVLAFARQQVGLRARAQQAYMHAYQLRDRLTPPERYSIEAMYHLNVEGDRPRAVAAWHNLRDATRSLAPNRFINHSGHYTLLFQQALSEAEKILIEDATSAPNPMNFSTLAWVRHALGRPDEARAAVEEGRRKWPTNAWLGMDLAHLAVERAGYREAHALAERIEPGPTRPFALRAEAAFDGAQGKLSEARKHLDALVADRLDNHLNGPALEAAVHAARMRLVAGDTAGSLRYVEDFIGRYPLTRVPAEERPYLQVALFYADVGRPNEARRLISEYERWVPNGLKGPDRWMQHRVRAALLMAVDSPRAALNELLDARNAMPVWSEWPGSWPGSVLFAIEDRPELARVYARLGEADSAIAVLERYVEARVLYRSEMDALHLGHALRRLADLHEEKGRPAVAAAYHARLVDLWREADAELRPFVSHARSRSAPKGAD